jgi:hypothetical protein
MIPASAPETVMKAVQPLPFGASVPQSVDDDV